MSSALENRSLAGDTLVARCHVADCRCTLRTPEEKRRGACAFCMGSGAVYSGAESPSEEENETLELDKFRNFRPWRPLRIVPCDWFQDDVGVAEDMEVDSLGMEVDLFGPKPSDANLDHDPCAENAGYPDNAIGQMRGDNTPVAAVDDAAVEGIGAVAHDNPEAVIAEMDYEAERLHGTDDVGTTPTPVAKGLVYTVTTERINVFMAVFMSQQPFALDTTPIPYTGKHAHSAGQHWSPQKLG